MSVRSSLMILGIVLPALLFSGCTTLETPGESPEFEKEEETVWYAPVVEKSEYFTDLNLDGTDGNDDQAIITTYRWEGSPEDSYTLLSIKLGTGEVLSKGFIGWVDFAFQTGYITSKEKETIILEISSKTSTFSAATVYVLEIEEDDAAFFLEEPIIVGDFSERNKHTNCMDVPMLTIGTTILESGPDELDMVRIFEVDIDYPAGEDIPHTLAWSGIEWTYD